MPNQSYLTVDTYGASAMFPGQTMFDIPGLEPYADAFMVMAYDMGFSNGSTHTLPNAPLTGPYTYTDTSIMQSYIQVAPAAQVILGVPYYGYKFSTTTTAFNSPVNYSATGSSCPVACADTYSGILADLGCASQLGLHWDTPSQTPWATWYSPGSNDPCGGNHYSYRELYYDNA